MMNSWPRHLAIGTFIILVSIGVWRPAESTADDGLEWDTTLTYQLKVDEGTVNLVSDLTLTNKTPDRRSGNTITQYYFDQIWITVPEEATNLSVLNDGKDLTYTIEEEIEEEDDIVGLDVVEIRFPRRIFYNRSIDIRVEYDIPGDDPRSESLFRVNPAYASFSVVSWGDPGRIEVKVILDDRFDVNTDGADYDVTHDGSDIVYTMTDIEDPSEWFMVFTARNDDNLEDSKADLAGFDVVLRAWPSDDWWASEVEKAVETGLPKLHELVGLDWRPDEELEIRESIEPNLLGYGGWYLDCEDVIEIGEYVDRHLVLHEIGHSWFNEDLFVERWITEGLSDQYAWEAIQSLEWASLTDARPTEEPVSRDGVYTPPLNGWQVVDLDQAGVEKTEEYGYAMSWWLMQALSEEIGVEALTAVVAAADADEIAYRSDGTPETVGATDDWRRFIDLLQEVGGSAEAPSLFEEYVLLESESLDDRRAARNSYEALEQAAHTWSTPLIIREPMSEWEFSTASDHIESALDVLELRDEIDALTAELGVQLPPSLEAAYEAADPTFSAALELGQDQREASESVLDAKVAVDAEPGLLATIGLIGQDPELEYEEAVTALENDAHEDAISEADEVLALLGAAKDVGTSRAVKSSAALLALLITILLGVILLVRRSRRRAATNDAISESAPAADTPDSGASTAPGPW